MESSTRFITWGQTNSLKTPSSGHLQSMKRTVLVFCTSKANSISPLPDSLLAVSFRKPTPCVKVSLQESWGSSLMLFCSCLDDEEIAFYAYKSRVPNRKAWESVPIGMIPGKLWSQQERQVQAYCITQVLQLEKWAGLWKKSLIKRLFLEVVLMIK